MKIRLMVVLIVLSLVTIVNAEEVVPYDCTNSSANCEMLDSVKKLERTVARLDAKRVVSEDIPAYSSKSSEEMLAKVRNTLKRVETMNTPQPENPVNVVSEVKVQPIQTEKSKEKVSDYTTPILVGLYVVCFIFGGIVFYGIGKSSGHETAMNEIRISNAQNLWNQYLKSFTGGQTNGR
jgi:hypothetical protein